MLITIAQTENKEEDLARLQHILDVIRNYPGEDEVSLAVTSGTGQVKMEMPHFSTGYCPELHQQLAGLVGEEGLKLET